MKYAFATILVILALVCVFHPESAKAMPRAVSGLLTRVFTEYMPFGAKAEYAEACVEQLRESRSKIRHEVCRTAVGIRELDSDIATLHHRRVATLQRIQALMNAPDKATDVNLARVVSLYDRLDELLAQKQQLRARVATTLASLEGAESEVGVKVDSMADRLELVKLDHAHNNARELAADLTDPDYPGRSSTGAHCAEVIEHLERDERVREDMHDRYGPEPDALLVDPRSRAEAILRDNGC